jgi:hypothetical protein
VNTTTASGVFVTLLTLPIVTQVGTRLLVHATASSSNQSLTGQSVFFRVTLDGVAQRAFANIVSLLGGNTAQAGAVVLILTGLAAGAHTIELQWMTTGGTAQVRPIAAANQEHASLLVQELL